MVLDAGASPIQGLRRLLQEIMILLHPHFSKGKIILKKICNTGFRREVGPARAC